MDLVELNKKNETRIGSGVWREETKLYKNSFANGRKEKEGNGKTKSEMVR